MGMGCTGGEVSREENSQVKEKQKLIVYGMLTIVFHLYCVLFGIAGGKVSGEKTAK